MTLQEILTKHSPHMTPHNERVEEMSKECKSCKRNDESVTLRKVKENGVLGYYDIEREWCDKCVASHNYHLMANWG